MEAIVIIVMILAVLTAVATTTVVCGYVFQAKEFKSIKAKADEATREAKSMVTTVHQGHNHLTSQVAEAARAIAEVKQVTEMLKMGRK